LAAACAQAAILRFSAAPMAGSYAVLTV